MAEDMAKKGLLAQSARFTEESEGREMAGRWVRLPGMTPELDQRLAQALLPSRIPPTHPDPPSMYLWADLPKVLYPQTLAAIDEALSRAPYTRESPPSQKIHGRQRKVVGLLRDMGCNASTPTAVVRHAAEVISKAHTSPETKKTERGFSVHSVVTDWQNRRKEPAVLGRPASLDGANAAAALRDAEPVLTSRRNHTFFGNLGEMLFTIRYAEVYLYLSSFIISHAAITEALVRASKRGVDVRVLTAKNQSGNEGFTSEELLLDLQAADVIVVTELNPMTYENCMVADDAVLMCGSSDASSFGYPAPNPKTGKWEMARNMELNTFTCETPISEHTADRLRKISTNPKYRMAVDDAVFN